MGEEEGQGFLTGAFAGGAMMAPTLNPFAIAGGAFVGGIIGAEGASAQAKAKKKAEKEAERMRVEAVIKEMGKRQQASQMQLAGLQRPKSSTETKTPSVNSSTGLMGDAFSSKNGSSVTGTF